MADFGVGNILCVIDYKICDKKVALKLNML